ncbi:MAG: type II toxin-antitoxin system HipA family toxin [Pseudobdellovibrionaceae bacterium]
MLKQIYVYIYLNDGWVPCGLLKFSESGRFSSSTFRYGLQYLQRSDALSVDPIQLPLMDVTHESPDGHYVFNGIRDAAPDKWGRYLLEKKFGRSLSEIEFIAASAEDRVGALAFSSRSDGQVGVYDVNGDFKNTDHTQKKISKLGLSDCLGAVDDALLSVDSKRLKAFLEYGPSLGGARPKASVDWKEKQYLAKFSVSHDSKDEALIEYASMSLAKKCGINVPAIDLHYVDGRSIYLIERFDRQGTKRIPFISGLTITGLHESEYSNWSYYSLADAIIKFSSNHEKDLQELFRRLIFNIAVYNNDDHLRNFGFICSDSRHWDLSPAYDIVPSLIHSDTYALAMTCGPEGKIASFKNALSMAPKFRLSDQKAKEIIEEIKDSVRPWRVHFADLGVKASEIKMLEKSFAIKL